jgi:type VI secretion system protein ImpH
MASSSRRSARNLIAEIQANGPRFDFFQAIRLLALSQKKGNRTSSLPESLRFGSPLTLAFPASEILQVENLRGNYGSASNASHVTPSTEATADPEHNVPAMLVTVGFMGMTGPSGVLPTAYTELLMDRRNFHRDTAAHHFLDIFTHRAVTLFYQAWHKHRFYIAHESQDSNDFSRSLLDFVGVGLEHLQHGLMKTNGGIPDVFLIHYSGLLSQKPLSASNIAALVRGYFRVEATLKQFIGQWILVPNKEQTRLSMQSNTLGQSAFVGQRIWDRQTKIRIELGPLTHQQFHDLLPGNPGAIALQELVKFSIGHSLSCDVALVLKSTEIPVPKLSVRSGQSAPMLGYNLWLFSHPTTKDAWDARFSLFA